MAPNENYSGVEQAGDGQVRFTLERRGRNELVLLALTPGSADENSPDATISRLMGFAGRGGDGGPFDGFLAISVCARRNEIDGSVDLALHERNLSEIGRAAANLRNPTVLVAWGDRIGRKPYLRDFLGDIIDLLSACSPVYKCAGVTGRGNPRQITRAPYGPLEDFDVRAFLASPVPPASPDIDDEDPEIPSDDEIPPSIPNENPTDAGGVGAIPAESARNSGGSASVGGNSADAGGAGAIPAESALNSGESASAGANSADSGEVAATAESAQNSGGSANVGGNSAAAGEVGATAESARNSGGSANVGGNSADAGEVVATAESAWNAGESANVGGNSADAGEVVATAESARNSGGSANVGGNSADSGEVAATTESAQNSGESASAGANSAAAGEVAANAESAQNSGGSANVGGNSADSGGVGAIPAESARNSGGSANVGGNSADAGEIDATTESAQNSGGSASAGANSAAAGEVAATAESSLNSGESANAGAIPAESARNSGGSARDDDGFSLDVDDEGDGFSLDVDEDDGLSLDDGGGASPDGAAAGADGADSAESASDGGRPGVDEFWERVVEPFERSRSPSFRHFLEQGNVPAEVVYGIVALPAFAVPTAEDSERISRWAEEWSREAQKYGRTDVSRYNDVKDAAETLRSFFTNARANRSLSETLRAVAWSHVETHIATFIDTFGAERRGDVRVGLREQAALRSEAERLGLFNGVPESEVSGRVAEEVARRGARLGTLEDEFRDFFEARREAAPVNALDTYENRVELAKRYKKLRLLSDRVAGRECGWSDRDFLRNLPDLLSRMNLELVQPPSFFSSDYFDSYAREHDVSRLSEAEFAELRSAATGKYYRLTDAQWDEFAQAAGVSVVRSEPSEDEIAARLAEERERAEAEKERERVEYEARLAEERRKAEAARRRAAHARRNGIVRSFLAVVAMVAVAFAAVALFKRLRPVQYAGAVESVAELVAPSEEQREQARLAREQARLSEEASRPRALTVGVRSDDDFRTLDEALGKVRDGDTILLPAGVHVVSAAVTKAVTITGGDAAAGAVGSGYFSSKDVPVVVPEHGTSLRVAAKARFSGLVIAGRTGVSFQSFQSFRDSARRPAREPPTGDDPMARGYSALLRVVSDASFDRCVFAQSEQNCAVVTAGSVSFDGCAFLNAPGSAVHALSLSRVELSSCSFTGVGNAVRAADGATVRARSFSASGVWCAVRSAGKSRVSLSSADVRNFRDAAFRIGEESSLVVGTGRVSTSATAGRRAGLLADGAASAEFGSVAFDDAVFGASLDGAASAKFGFCTVSGAGAGDAVCAVEARGGSRVSMEGCVVSCYPTGISLRGKASAEIVRTKIRDGQFGVLFQDESGGSLGGEVSAFQRGVVVSGKSAPRIAGLSVRGCSKAGLTYKDGSGGSAESCEISEIAATGVSINDDSAPSLSSVRVSGAKTGFLSSERNRAALSDCAATGCEAGFSVFWDGDNSPENEISGGSFSSNSGAGISAFGGARLGVSGAEASSNGTVGVRADGSAKVSATGLRLQGNAEAGILLGGSAECSVSDTEEGGSDSGILLGGSSVCVARGSRFMSNASFGAGLAGSASLAAEDCEFSRNGDVGLAAAGSASAALSECEIVGNGGVGATTDGKAALSLARCKVKNNGGDNFSFGSSVPPELSDLSTNLWTQFLMWLDSL